MSINQILLFSAVIIISRFFHNTEMLRWVLFAISLIAIYWFQPLSSIRTLDFWLPTIVLMFSIFSWSIFYKNGSTSKNENLISIILILLFFIILIVSRLLDLKWINSIVTNPNFSTLIVSMMVLLLLFLISVRKRNTTRLFPAATIILILCILVILKSQFLSLTMSIFLRRINGQLITLSAASDFVWIGFSYFSFRLIHSILDRERLIKLNISLRDYLTYLLFFPSYIAGPIDRLENFEKQIEFIDKKNTQSDFINGFIRIIRGMLFKFIIADSLAIISLDSRIANQIVATTWAWVIVYCYAFRIFFDFAGYTDIAVGIAKLAGITLSENFNRPYLSRNITLFWNNWHITLTQWFRIYYFNPLTRFLRKNFGKLSPGFIIFFTQITTMVLIGLWHGISWNFVIWGLWNGIGLFLHNRWSAIVVPNIKVIRGLKETRWGNIASVILNFNFIAIGWVWFALPSLKDSTLIFGKLFGI